MWDTSLVALEELEILARIRDLFPGGRELDDDCGLVPPPASGERLLVTTDLLQEGIHFILSWHPPELLARKLLAVNLSDLDASGANPMGFTLTLALPPALDPSWLDAFLRALAETATKGGLRLLGGDTVGSPTGLGLGMTAFGSARRWLRRSGMQPGDRIFVDQPLGLSLQGLRRLQGGDRWDPALPDPALRAHLCPEPRLGLGRRLAELPEVHACMDLSDGLSRDLRSMALASNCSVALAPDLSPDEIEGGEDYARCFATPLGPEELRDRLGLSFRQVGRALPRAGSPLGREGDAWVPVPDRAFDHFRP
ncbi:MAG: thiamine-phosphate kinase [Acidobacteria bacterium]|nr:thiamine-phosphate kinase [Acidobacteriota bacterium]